MAVQPVAKQTKCSCRSAVKSCRCCTEALSVSVAFFRHLWSIEGDLKHVSSTAPPVFTLG